MSNQWNNEQAWDLADIVGKSYAVISHLSDKIAAEAGVTTSQVVALAVLKAFPDGLTQTQWGKYQGVSRQRASVVAKALAAQGAIESNPRGRSTMVTLTPKGARWVQQHKKIFGSAMKKKLGNFSKQDGEHLATLLDKLIRSIEQAP